MTWRRFRVAAELALTRQQRREIASLAWRHTWRSPITLITVTLWLLIVVLTPHFLGRWLSDWLVGRWLPPLWAKTAAIGIIGSLNIAIFTVLWVRLYLRPMRRALCDIGFDICLRCGYWLRGLGADISQCPECGAMRRPPETTP